MKHPVAACAVALLVSSTSHAIETLRISMGDARSEATLISGQLGYGPDGDEAVYRSSPGGRASVRLTAGRLEVDGAPVTGPSIRFRAGQDTFDAGVPGRDTISVNGFSVRGDVVVRLVHGKLQLINVIPLEEYLAAVLGSEMPRSFPLEALKAQAIAARTYALEKKLKALDAPFHVGSTVLHQVYGGAAREDPRTLEAVQATGGQVLTYDLQPIEAYFHASCGGRTENGAEALGRDLPYLHSVTCPCEGLPQSRWELTVGKRELERMGLAGGTQLAVAGRSATGRARRVELGRGKQLSAVTFRERVGYTRLKSLSFEISETEEDTLFRGRGYGHGAGLCQWGAKVLADKGWSYQQILDHYYAGAELQVLY